MRRLEQAACRLINHNYLCGKASVQRTRPIKRAIVRAALHAELAARPQVPSVTLLWLLFVPELLADVLEEFSRNRGVGRHLPRVPVVKTGAGTALDILSGRGRRGNCPSGGGGTPP